MIAGTRMRGYDLRNVLLVTLAFLACSPAEPTATVESTTGPSAAVGRATEPAAPQEPAVRAPEQNITIDGVEIANPIVVTGHARTFENNVVLRARDAHDEPITETFATSEGEMGNHNPFRATLWLTRHPGDRIVVEALEYSAKDGSEQSLVDVEKPFAVEAIEAKLYFPDADCTRVQPYTRRLPKSMAMARLLVEALIAGPLPEEGTAGAAAPFPKGSRVESVNLRGGVLTVDFNERLQNVGGSCQALMIRQSVTETLRALPAVKKVVITAHGSEALALQP